MSDVESEQVHLIANRGWDERVLVCRYGELVNTFIVVSDRYVVLVDTMLNPQIAAQLLDLARPHRTAGRQLLVVNTHADWDHAWGNQLFAGPGATHPAPIIAHRRCADRLREPEAQQLLAQMQAQQPAQFATVRLTPPTILFNEQLVIDGGDLTLVLFATPGHQPDHISVYLPEIATLLAGDAAEFPFPSAASAAALPDLRASLARMADLNPAMALYCHAPVTSGRALLHDNMAYFDMLEQKCHEALRRGVPAQPAPEADVETLVGFPLIDALPFGTTIEHVSEYYHQGHRALIRAMLESAAQ